MQSELKSLSKIFSETIFRIPDYQRGYSWEAKQLKDFWNDIEQLPEGKSHYTGVLTLEPVDSQAYSTWGEDLWIIQSKRYSPIHIVDGQQRLTTAVVLMQVILDAISDSEMLNYTERSEIRKKYIYESRDQGISRSYIFGYEKDNPSYEFLKQSVFGEASSTHSIPEETIYTKNLRAAKEFFSERVGKLDSAGKERVFTVLTQSLLFNIFYIEKGLDVFVTFETMNNRGKGLSHLELLKNRLIYLSTKFDVDLHEKEHLRKCVNESWKTVYHFLGKVPSRKLSDDIFLMTHFVCYFGSRVEDFYDANGDFYSARHYFRHDDRYKDYLLEEVFTPKRLGDEISPLSVDEIYEYAKHIKNAVKIYHDVVSPEFGSWHDQEKVFLLRINRISEYGLFLLTVSSMLYFQPGPKRRKLLEAIEAVAFLTKIRAYFFQSIDCYELSILVSTGKISIDDLSMQLFNSARSFVKSSEFVEAIRSVGKTGGYYRWGALRYFMYEYEQSLRKKSKTSRQILTWSDYADEVFDEDYKTIEHIYPQKASDPYWRKQFERYSVPERNLLKNSLGNLLPVSHAKNSSLSNKSFDAKKGSKSSQIGYRYGCLSEIQVSEYSDWGAKEILRRGVGLLNFMEICWGLELGGLEDKIKILGLEFVLQKENLSFDDVADF